MYAIHRRFKWTGELSQQAACHGSVSIWSRGHENSTSFVLKKSISLAESAICTS